MQNERIYVGQIFLMAAELILCIIPLIYLLLVARSVGRDQGSVKGHVLVLPIAWCLLSCVSAALWCAHYCCWNHPLWLKWAYCWCSSLFLRSWVVGAEPAGVHVREECQLQGYSFFAQGGTDGDHAKGISLPRTQHIPTLMSTVYPWAAPSCGRKTVRSCLHFEEILKPEHNQQHLYFGLYFNAKNVHLSIWVVTKHFCELHRQEEEQRSTGPIKSKWWERSSQLWY